MLLFPLRFHLMLCFAIHDKAPVSIAIIVPLLTGVVRRSTIDWKGRRNLLPGTGQILESFYANTIDVM